MPTNPLDFSDFTIDASNHMIDTLAPWVRGPIPPKEATILIVEDSLSNFVLMARTLAYMGIPRCEWKISSWQVVEFVVLTIEADRKDKLKTVEFRLDLGEPELWVLPS